MQPPSRGIDHLFVTVRDLEDSARRYRQLGFTVSERGVHGAAKGSANHTIVFREDYLELLGFVAATPDNAGRRAALEREGDALQGIALRTRDARATAAALGARGIGTGDVGDFDRPLTLPDGSEARAAFTTVAVAASDTPVGHVFACQHRTPELVWRPEAMAHPNGALGLAGLVVRSDRAETVAHGFGELFDAAPERLETGAWSVDTGSIPIEVVDGERYRSDYAGLDMPGRDEGTRIVALRVAVDDLDRAREASGERTVASAGTVPGSSVPARHAGGVILQFVPG